MERNLSVDNPCSGHDLSRQNPMQNVVCVSYPSISQTSYYLGFSFDWGGLFTSLGVVTHLRSGRVTQQPLVKEVLLNFVGPSNLLCPSSQGKTRIGVFSHSSLEMRLPFKSGNVTSLRQFTLGSAQKVMTRVWDKRI